MSKNVKLVLEYDLGEFDEDYDPSIFPEDWYEYFYQIDVTDLINNTKIKKVIIYDTEMEK